LEGKVSDTESLRALYQAFGRGDVATILDKLDDAIEWETTVPVPDVPWLQARRGKANIVGFFESMRPRAMQVQAGFPSLATSAETMWNGWSQASRDREVMLPVSLA
jgi:hypothetical protein